MDGLKIDGVVAKAKNTYIDRVNKSETINKNRRNEKAADQRRVQQNQIPSKIANGKRVDDAQNQQILTELKPSTEEMRRRNDDTESEAESEISSRKPGYLDSDLEHARLAARTKDLKDLFEKWNYENNVYDTAAYNDSIPEYDEIDDSQTETTKTLVFENARTLLKYFFLHNESNVNLFVIFLEFVLNLKNCPIPVEFKIRSRRKQIALW